MDMVEVDRKLFVTCRLCIGDLGVYQIVPQVQQQIKYCFDIDVDLFDGLPQLICKKCKTILQEYFLVKQTFEEKQATLKKKLAVKKVETNNEEHDDTKLREGSVCSSTQDVDESIKPTRGKRKRCRLPSSTSSDNLEVQNTDLPEFAKKRHKPSKVPSWKDYYKRKFICQLCSKMYKKKNSFTKHLRKHNTLLSSYQHVFGRDCKVNLIKIDDEPNMTGSNDNVVVSSDKILSTQEKNNNYCVIYTPKKNYSGSRPNSSDGFENQGLNGDSCDEDIFGKKDYRTRSRTRSSNETVVLNDDNTEVCENINEVISDKYENANLSDAECINIDDSSDGETTQSNQLLRDSADMNPVRAKISDHKAIQNIISICFNKYLKKNECAENEMSKGSALDESKLKRIILNMGQKVVSKQGFNCTGLLRFMENSDLNIKWIQACSKSPKNIGKESSYVYIQPKLINKLNSKADNGWIAIPEQQVLPVNHLFETGESNDPRMCTKNNTNSTILPILNQADKAQRKLLNKSPVANPKQLPKKTYTNPSSENTDPEPVFSTEEVNGDNLYMPIITSTKSLAVLPTEVQSDMVLPTEKSIVSNNKDVSELMENSAMLNSRNVNESIEDSTVSNSKNKDGSIVYSAGFNNKNESTENSAVSKNINVNESDKILPRIKVKPVSELMSDRVLKNLSQTQQVNSPNIWETHPPSNIQPVAVKHVPIFMPNGSNSSPVQALKLIPYPCAGGSAAVTGSAQAVVLGSMPVPVPEPAPALAPAPLPTRPAPSEKEQVILDTVELPNTKTDSPFRYVKRLMQIHNLVLLDSHQNLTRDFVCLIKFKLQFKQDNVDVPVVLFLSFQCFGNQFYLGVKPSEQENNIDLSKLPATWQWEIINKVYREEVISKVLKNAQKICQSTHDYAKSFLCLLKSIKKRDP